MKSASNCYDAKRFFIKNNNGDCDQWGLPFGHFLLPTVREVQSILDSMVTFICNEEEKKNVELKLFRC